MKRTWMVAVALAAALLAAPSAFASQDVELNVIKGRSLMRAGDYAGAVSQFAAALTREEDNVDALYFQGRAYAAQGEFATAISSFEKVDTEIWPVNFDLGMAHYQLAQYEESAEAFAAAGEQGHNVPEARFYQGVSLYKLGQHEDAGPLLAEREGLPDELAAYAMLYHAQTLSKAGNAEEAASQREKLEAAYPDSKAASLSKALSEDLEAEITAAAAATDVTGTTGDIDEAAAEDADEEWEKPKFGRGKFILGYQYDTNPALVQDDLTVAAAYASPNAVSSPGAARAYMDLGLGFNFVRRQNFQWSIDLESYQNIHFPVADNSYLNFLRADIKTDFGVYIQSLAVEFGGGYHTIRSGYFDVNGAKDAIDIQSLGFSSVLDAFLGIQYSVGGQFYVDGAYALSKIDSVRGGFHFERDDYDASVGNARDGFVFDIPLIYNRILLEKLGLSATANLTPGAYKTDDAASPFGYGKLGLGAGVHFAPIKFVELGTQFSYTHRGYKNPQLDPIAGGLVNRSDNEVSGLLYGGIHLKSFVVSGSARWITNKSISLYTYRRAIYGVQLGWRSRS